MDEMIIRSDFTKGLISKIVKKVVKNKIGVTPDVMFNDAISIKKEGDLVDVHLNINVKLSADELAKLLKDLV